MIIHRARGCFAVSKQKELWYPKQQIGLLALSNEDYEDDGSFIKHLKNGKSKEAT